MIDLAGANWRTSSYSKAQGTECVEVAGNLRGVVAIRDSKHRETGTHIVSTHVWRSFIAAVTRDRF